MSESEKILENSTPESIPSSLEMLQPKIQDMILLRSLKRSFMFFLIPIVLSPFPLIIGTSAASCAFVIFVMGFFWVTETLPLPVTALIPTIAYPLLSIESAEVVSSAYMNDSNMMFFGSMVMAVAVESSRLHERVALRTLLFTGANPRFLMLGLQVATAFISLWMSNTSSTTMMLPLVLALIKELDMCEHSLETVSQRLVIQSENKKQTRIYKGLLLSIAYASAIGGAGTLIGTSSIISMNSHLQSLYGDQNPVAFFTYMCYSIPQVIILLLISWFWLQFMFIGFTKNDESNNQIVDDMIKKKYKDLGPMRYEEWTVLISFLTLIALWLSRPFWSKLFTASYVTDGTASILISLLLFVLPAENPFSSKTIEKLSINEPIRTVITWKLMREKFSWSTLFLLGGGFAMALGVKKSGLSTWICIKLSAMEGLPPWIFIAFSSAIVCTLTEIASNTATAAVFIPVVSSIAIAHNMNPLIYVLPITFASSFSFLFPSGTPPNAIVFSAKILHVSDMIIGGLIPKLGSFILCQIFAQTFSYVVFDLDSLNNNTIQMTTNNKVY